MRKAIVLYKGEDAGMLTQLDDGTFTFQYSEAWLANTTKPPISLNLPKQSGPFINPHLFPFFYHLLPEGSNKFVVCRNLRIDEKDDFGILLATARHDTIGAVTIKVLQEQ